MTAVIAYLGLGSNLDQPKAQIGAAMSALDGHRQITVTGNAGYYISKPMGPQDQPDYINTVLRVSTTLSPEQLLACCQEIEQAQGRQRKRHWGERTIDIDILLYADICMDTEQLVLPHPGITLRDFVYLPLLSIKEDIAVPGLGLLKNVIKNTVATGNYDCRYDGPIQ